MLTQLRGVALVGVQAKQPHFRPAWQLPRKVYERRAQARAAHAMLTYPRGAAAAGPRQRLLVCAFVALATHEKFEVNRLKQR